MLKYHQDTFKLLNREAIIDQQAVEQLDALEKQYHIKLPASVREWYSLKDAIELMDNGDDKPVSITEFDVIPKKSAPWGLHIENGLLTVMRNSGEWGDWVHWYVRLDGSDDPPVTVYERYRIGSLYPVAPSALYPVSPSFSEYIFAVIWDKQLDTGCSFHSDGETDIAPLGEETLQFLYSRFKPINARCDSIGKQILRFEREDQHIRIEITLNLPNNSYWRLHADSPISLYTLGKMVWHIDSLNTRLVASHHPDSEGALDRLNGQWEYQLSCSYEYKDKPLNRQDHDYLKARLPRDYALRWIDGAYVSEGYRFEDTGKQMYVAILKPQGILSWRLRSESLNQLASLVELISRWPRVLDNLMPDSYADSYQETLDFIEGLRSQRNSMLPG